MIPYDQLCQALADYKATHPNLNEAANIPAQHFDDATVVDPNVVPEQDADAPDPVPAAVDAEASPAWSGGPEPFAPSPSAENALFNTETVVEDDHPVTDDIDAPPESEDEGDVHDEPTVVSLDPQWPGTYNDISSDAVDTPDLADAGGRKKKSARSQS